MIELKNYRISYGDVTPLKDVSVTINDGDVIAIIGPSGTGKSTLLRCINLLERPADGELWIDGEQVDMDSPSDVRKLHRKIGMVFQSCNLFENLTVIENVMIPQMEVLGTSKQEAYDKAIKLLSDVGLAEKIFNYPDSLSGGQRQRVAIARTLAMDSEVLLFDEPTSALDPTMVNEVLIVISQLAKQGKTMMIVTHEMSFARKVSNRVFYLDEGGIYEDGSPEQIFENPQREKTARFVKRASVLEFELTTETYDYPSVASEILAFANKYGIGEKRGNRLKLIFEELCHNILIEELKKAQKDMRMKVTIEYLPGDNLTSMDVKYCGNFNPEATDNSLAYVMLKHQTESLEYRALSSDPDGYLDEVSLRVK